MKRLFYKLTGGRPMRFVTYMFTDCVSGRPVNYWMDALNNPWMAEHRWSLFRVRPMHEPELWGGKS